MVQYFNNQKIISRYLQIFYEYSKKSILDFVLRKLFKITIYTLHELFTINELIELFKHYSVEKENRYVEKIIDDIKLFDIIEDQIY